MKLKMHPALKLFLQSSALRNHTPILVPSIGRSGSTLLYKSIIAGLAKKNRHLPEYLSSRLCADDSWELGQKQFKMGVVYKTHDLPDAITPDHNILSVFCFGSIIDSALSVFSGYERFGEDWIRTHFANLRSSAGFEDMLDSDALHFEVHMDKWFAHKNTPVLCVRYETLWEHQNEISEFLDIKVELPTKRARHEKQIAPEILKRIQNTYAPLDKKYASYPDIFTAGSLKL